MNVCQRNVDFRNENIKLHNAEMDLCVYHMYAAVVVTNVFLLSVKMLRNGVKNPHNGNHIPSMPNKHTCTHISPISLLLSVDKIEDK